MRSSGKTHIGLKFNPRIRLIKEHLPHLTKNQLTLKPLRSQLPRTSYLVHQGTTLSGETLLLEVPVLGFLFLARCFLVLFFDLLCL